MSASTAAATGPPGPPPGAGPAVAGAMARFAGPRRAWGIAALVGRIENARRSSANRIPLLLALDDAALMRAVGAGDEVLVGYRGFDRGRAMAAIAAAGLTAVCRHDPRYPQPLRELPDAPAV